MTRPALLGLGLVVAATPGAAMDLSLAERAAFGAEIRAYLLDHPEIIAEALRGAEARRQSALAADDIARIDAHAQALFHAPGDWTGGAAAGDLTLVSFIDYRDPASRRALDAARSLVAEDGALRWVVKEAPAPDDPTAQRAARFALAVLRLAGEDAYLRARTALFDAPLDDPARLDRIARELGLAPAAVAGRMEAADITAQLAATRAVMEALDLGPAPAQVVGHVMVRGDVPAVALARIVAALRRKK